MFKNLKRLLVIILIWFGFHTIFITMDGLIDSDSTADVAVVLGNKVNTDGTLSKRLDARMSCSLDVFNKGKVKYIIVSGGLGKEGFYEGDKMREYLISHQVPDSNIIVDNKGDNTELTVTNTIEISKKYKFKSAIVVSQFYHVTRTKMLFRKVGFPEISSVSPMYFETRDFYSLFREFFAYYWVIIKENKVIA